MTKVGVYALLRVGTLMSEDQAAASILGVGAVLLRPRHADRGRDRHARGATPRAAREPFRRHLDRHPARGARARHRGVDRARPVLLDHLGAHDRHVLHADRHDGPHARKPVGRHAVGRTEPQAPFYVAFGVAEPDPYGTDEDVGVAIPSVIAFLGLIFVSCVLLVTGLPPLPGFVAKFALLSTAIGAEPAAGSAPPRGRSRSRCSRRVSRASSR